MTARFTAFATPIPGLTVLERRQQTDERGMFERLFCAAELAAFGHPGTVAQVNRSRTAATGAVRGMHLQRRPHGEWKVISCLRGSVRDVIVDLRRGSPTLRRWHGVDLHADGNISLLVPPGCAHGFQVTGGPAELLYLHSHPFVPDAEMGVRADDPRIGIDWPLPLGQRSARDLSHPLIGDDFPGIDA